MGRLAPPIQTFTSILGTKALVAASAGMHCTLTLAGGLGHQPATHLILQGYPLPGKIGQGAVLEFYSWLLFSDILYLNRYGTPLASKSIQSESPLTVYPQANLARPKSNGILRSVGIKISDLPKAQVLAALYNASVPTGASILHYRHGFLTTAEAEQLLHQDPDLQERVDYLRGRRVKLDFTPPAWDPLPYEQTTGTGTASKVLEILRHTKQPDHPEIQHLHYQLLKKQRDQEGWTLAKLVSLQLPEVLKGLEAADRAT